MCKMYLINNNYSKINFCGLIPKREYKGPILKLTDEDKNKIDVLQKTISQLELDLYKLKLYFEHGKKTCRDLDYYYTRRDMLRTKIEILEAEIKDIKKERLNKQRS